MLLLPEWEPLPELPCAFEEYEIFQDGEWKRVANGIPTDKDRIRFLK